MADLLVTSLTLTSDGAVGGSEGNKDDLYQNIGMLYRIHVILFLKHQIVHPC